LQDIGVQLQEVGAEWGVTTGRRRRTGWLDLVVMRYSTMINGYTSLNLTKLDVLDGFKEIKVATGYKIDGKEIEGFPGEFGISRPGRWFAPSWSDALTRIPLRFILVADLDLLAKVEVEYATFPGWESDISECTTFESLPENCQKYVKFIEDFLGVKVEWIGVGPARHSTIKCF